MVNEQENQRTFAAAFLDGFSMAGLFSQLKRPGAPTRVFAHSPEAIEPNESRSNVSREELENAQRILNLAGFEVRPRNTSSAH
jgi:hypothetical protein